MRKRLPEFLYRSLKIIIISLLSWNQIHSCWVIYFFFFGFGQFGLGRLISWITATIFEHIHIKFENSPRLFFTRYLFPIVQSRESDTNVFVFFKLKDSPRFSHASTGCIRSIINNKLELVEGLWSSTVGNKSGSYNVLLTRDINGALEFAFMSIE